jgi:hypothetical protein
MRIALLLLVALVLGVACQSAESLQCGKVFDGPRQQDMSRLAVGRTFSPSWSGFHGNHAADQVRTEWAVVSSVVAKRMQGESLFSLSRAVGPLSFLFFVYRWSIREPSLSLSFRSRSLALSLSRSLSVTHSRMNGTQRGDLLRSVLPCFSVCVGLFLVHVPVRVGLLYVAALEKEKEKERNKTLGKRRARYPLPSSYVVVCALLCVLFGGGNSALLTLTTSGADSRSVWTLLAGVWFFVRL